MKWLVGACIILAGMVLGVLMLEKIIEIYVRSGA